LKIQIIPDIHTDFVRAETMIRKEKADKIIFLGDYFDQFNDTLEVTHQVGTWLKKSLEDPNRIHLLGNHDLSYLNGNYGCAGYSEGKLWAIRNSKVNLTKLQDYCWAGDWLCTHAGLTNNFYKAYKQNGESVNDFLQRYSKDKELRPRLFNCSPARGGRDAYSGIVWCDYWEFQDIPQLKQIFGHTNKDVRHIEESNGTEHYCIDAGLRYYAVLEDNNMVVRN